MMEYGGRVTSDLQCMFLRERLNALEDGWAEIYQTYENRKYLWYHSPNLQMFHGDGKQAKMLLSLQNHLLLHTFLPDRVKLHDSTQERKILVQEDTYRSVRTIHSKRIRDQTFHSKVQTNKDRIDKIHGPDQVLLKSKKNGVRTLVQSPIGPIGPMSGKFQTLVQLSIGPIGQTGVTILRLDFKLNLVVLET